MSRVYPDVSNGKTPSFRPTGFPDWLSRIQKAKGPDEARSLLYYGFQPLYDALVEKRIADDLRPVALDLLDAIIQFNTQFVSGYYTGEPLPDGDALEALAPKIEQLAGVHYRTKERNIGLYDGDGRNLCTPSHIQEFLRSLVDAVEAKTLPAPDYVVVCACGSSEVGMPMSTLFEVPLGFIRRSKRRGDEKPVTIAEHIPILKKHSKAKVVWVVEDFVCTGQSIQSVMAQIQTYKPKQVVGLSMARNMGDSLTSKLRILHTLPGRHGSYAYETQ